MNYPQATILSHGIVRNEGDFLRLNIIDWKRYTHYWESEQGAIDSVAPSFVNRCLFKVVRVNLYEYPKRNDFPGWEHPGNHPAIGKLYWNHFRFVFPESRLCFSDMPDLFGFIQQPNGKQFRFYGDIGKVSPIAMKTALAGFQGNPSEEFPFDIWISVIDTDTQIILERLQPATDQAARKVAHCLNEHDILYHSIDRDIFIEKGRNNILIGNIDDLAQLSVNHLNKLIEAA